MATYFYTKVTKIPINNSDQLSNGTIKTGYSFTDEGNLLIPIFILWKKSV